MIDIYHSNVASKKESLKVMGAAIYSICEHQDCNAIINSFLYDVFTYDMCNYMRKALKDSVVRNDMKSTLYIFTNQEFSTFCAMASEDNSKVMSDNKQITSISILSNLLFTTDKNFLQSDIPELNTTTRNRYCEDHVYVIRLLHKVKRGDEQVSSEDIVVYAPRRFLS